MLPALLLLRSPPLAVFGLYLLLRYFTALNRRVLILASFTALSQLRCFNVSFLYTFAGEMFHALAHTWII